MIFKLIMSIPKTLLHLRYFISRDIFIGKYGSTSTSTHTIYCNLTAHYDALLNNINQE